MLTLMVLDVVVSVADIAFLALLLFIVRIYTDATLPGGRLAFLVGWFTGARALFSVAVFFLLFSVKNILGFLVFRAQGRFLYRVATRLSRQRLLRYLEGEYSGYTDVDSAVHIREISYHPLDFGQHVLGGIQQMVTQAVLIGLTVGAMLFYNARLFVLLFAILLPPLFVVFYWIRRKLRGARKNARTSSERSLQHLQEAVGGYVESNLYDRNQVFLERFMVYQRQFNKHVTDQLIVQGMPGRIIEIFALLGIVILIGVSQWMGTGSGPGVITIGIFMAAAYKIIPGVVKLLSLGSQVNSYAFTVDDLARPGPNTQAKNEKGVPLDIPIDSIQFDAVRFSYGGRRILEDQQLDLRPGDLLGISGPSGKGKTTIVNILLGFLSPQQGEVRINGQRTDAVERQRYWPRIAYVKQQPFLIHDTILNNVTLNSHPVRGKDWQEAVRASGLDSLMAGHAEKEQRMIAENGKNISGGQRQRIAIARALYKKADLVILDEPFNELDEESEHRLLAYFQQLAKKGKMVILITHNQQSLNYCTKTLFLDEVQA